MLKGFYEGTIRALQEYAGTYSNCWMRVSAWVLQGCHGCREGCYKGIIRAVQELYGVNVVLKGHHTGVGLWGTRVHNPCGLYFGRQIAFWHFMGSPW